MSAAAAAGVVCGALWWLMTAQVGNKRAVTSTGLPMQVAWIDRPQTSLSDDEVLSDLEVIKPAAVRQADTRVARGPPSEERTEVPAASETDGRAQVDLSLPAASIVFRTDEVGARYRRVETPPLMRVEFTDSSLGGTLQRMQQSVICAELRYEASRASASSEQIAASMARHGCGR